MDKKPKPTPENFATYDEAAEFWDTHDTTDYLDEFHTVEVEAELRGRHFEVEIEEDLVKRLQAVAEKREMSLGQLTSELLRKQLKEAA